MQTEEINLSPNSKIKPLPHYLVDQIKAGEVVERPSSLLKELLENSIDAKATEIFVSIKANGLELILIEDNGEGMTFDDLNMAFQRHATSKLHKFEDLYSLKSFGFRGEALASAASISRISCFSSTKEAGQGGKIVIEAGQVTYHQKENVAPGTSMAIRDLFYNTPARLKFIKGQLAEKNSIKKILTSFLISNPDKKWAIQIDDKEKEIYLPKSKIDRFKDLLKKARKESDKVQTLEKEYQNIKVEILVSPTQSNTEFQFIFVNSRLIEDRTLLSIAQKALQGAHKIQPSIDQKFNFILFITTPLDFVDVNVHPNKTIVKFQQFSIINSLIYNVCQESLLLYPTILPSTNSINLSPNESKNYLPDFLAEASSKKTIETTTRLSVLGEYFFIFKEEWIEIVCYDKMISKQISSFYKNDALTKDELLIPLLVGLPLQMENASEISDAQKGLKELNIDCLVQDNLILIKGIPSFLNYFGLFVIEILKKFLRDPSLKQGNIKEHFSNFLKIDNLKSIMSAADLGHYLEKVNSSLPEKTQYRRVLNKASLQLFFEQL